MSKGGGAATVSTYYVSIHFVLGMGAFDKLLQIQVGEKVAWQGDAMDTTISINSPELFGGNSREGGIVGDLDVLSGKATQTKNTYLMSVLGAAIPAFRQVTSLVWKQGYIGTNYYLKPWSFLCERIHTRLNGLPQWQDSLAEIGTNSGLMNIVHMVRECLIDPYWGRGFPESYIDETTFASVAQTCYNEGLGFAVYWTQESKLDDFINELLKHIQASLYRDRKTGKYKLHLVRKLPSMVGVFTINDSNSRNISEVKRKSIGDLVSQVEVKFKNNLTNKDDSVIVTDSSLASRQREPKKNSVTYIACATKEVAHKLALRDLAQGGLPLVVATGIEVDRTAEDLFIGAPFVLDRSDYFPEPVLMRVVQISLGDAINGRITIDAMQDNFHAADLTYPSLPASSWVDPISLPEVATFRTVFEVPYYSIAKLKGDAYAQGVDELQTFVAAAAGSPSDISYSAGIWTTTGVTYIKKNTIDFCCTGLLSSAMTKTSTTFTVSNLEDAELLDVGTFIKIGNEFVGLIGRSTNTFTVKRGVLDTVPLAHSIGTRFFCVEEYSATDNTTYFIGETVNVKLTPKTPKGELPVNDAPADNITLLGRMHLPYPPGNLKINEVYWPSTTTGAAANNIVFLIRGNGANNSTTFIDLSSEGNAITNFGTVKVNSAITDPYGNNGGVIECIGASGLSLAYNPDLVIGTQEFTFSCYVYVISFSAPASSNQVTVFYTGIRNTTSIGGGHGLYLTPTYIVFEDVKSTGTATSSAVSFTFPTGVWQHVVVQRTATTLETYVQGTKITGQTATFLTNDLGNPNNLPTMLGVSDIDTNPSSLAFAGNHYISEAKLIIGESIYTGNFTPPVAPTNLVAINLTYTSRNRFQQTVNLLDYYSGNITSEVGITYKAELRRTDTNALLDSVAGVTTLNMALSTAYLGNVNLKVWSVNANGECFYPVEHNFTIV